MEEKKLSFKTADELTNFLLDLQGQIVNLTETVDKLSPVKETDEETDTPDEQTDTPDEQTEKLSDEEISEIDQLLQSE